ncbi:amino acid permease [Planctomyces sp. SH-PL62]|uniref:amino acid permease n=1 Tax=Planctomyces sp. SH-PL62 TaxID=1636152 RepID=UPI00078D4D30|nr:amino acid permease [Planctomyces sp. SH-PL62]AMV38673.1 putative amino acid permease YhdG [Planctomyces sp. SH-PL62]
MANLWVRKSIATLKAEAAASEEHGLKRTLTGVNLIMLGIGAVIGAGFFGLTGEASARYAGPAISLSFILGGIVCAFAGLCYAEMASTVPVAGSAYTYAYATMGEFIAWLIGWDLILEYMVGATTVAINWSGYVASFLHDRGIDLPPRFLASPGTKMIEVPDAIAGPLHLRHGWSMLDSVKDRLIEAGIDYSAFAQVDALFNAPAMLIVALVTALLVVGIKESARVNNVIVFVKVSILVLLIVLGLPMVDSKNWGGSYIQPSVGPWYNFEYGWSGVLRAAGLVFFAYIGFDAVSTTAQEAKNPQRDMPIGIIGSLVICTILYFLGSIVLTGVVNYKQLHVPDPVAVATDAMRMPWLSFYVKIGAIAGLSSVILVMLMSQPRIFYAMSKDGLLPGIVGKIHPRFHTPYITTIITGCIVMVAAAVLPLSVAGELTSIGTLFAFAVVSAGTLYLRIKQPDIERPFRAPAIWFTAPMGVLSAVALMLPLPFDTWIRLIVWMAIGLVIYFAYGKNHSVLGNRPPEDSLVAAGEA